ncbi:MAG: F0F1 ATP synthase subunit delta [Xanthomonadales bacterium]|nr:F0F1 ATP synthase subunit delta [Xanthomonadales bacterium]
MSNLTKLARPYAKAAFEMARADSALAKWSRMLGSAASIVANPDVRKLIDSPGVFESSVAKLVRETGGERFNAKFAHFIDVLAGNERLSLLPEIKSMFTDLRLEEEKELAVKVVSAVELSDDQKKRMSDALARRFDRNIELRATVDPALIGGAIIHAGDMVIDGSIKGELNKLAVQLAD